MDNDELSKLCTEFRIAKTIIADLHIMNKSLELAILRLTEENEKSKKQIDELKNRTEGSKDEN